MIINRYILTTLRLMTGKWWLSVIKIFSLTSGIISLLLICLFYFDRQSSIDTYSPANILLPSFILLFTSLIYFFIMKSQVSVRRKELFWRKFYGETRKGIVLIFMIETSIFMLISFVLSLIFIDQLVPFFNLVTQKNVNIRTSGSWSDLGLSMLFLSVPGFIIGFLPSLWYARNNAGDILKKLP